MTALPIAMPITHSEPPLEIIVAEDEAITRYRLVAALEMMGHPVRAFGDGLQAWEAFQQQPTRIIIRDWEMPGLSGPEFCQRVRTADRSDYS
jgi:CheY-like chemotaxis protein